MRHAILFALAAVAIGAAVALVRPATTCGGKVGEPCGCPSDICREPCIDCCETVPCPVEGCSHD